MPRIFRIIPVLALMVMLFPTNLAKAQAGAPRPPVEMMVLIDNSCSMFPVNQILAGCDAYGSDVSFLRIAGANLFIARLGFGETNQATYKLGVISIGDEPELVSPLAPLDGKRDSLAALIANPKAQPASGIIPALELAYEQLGSNGESRDRIPAVVMITDGVPWPREGQENEVIEELAAGHQEIPLFIMLLQNPNRITTDYENYIKFWEGLQSKYHHIFIYRLRQASEIQTTYNAILGRLQNSIPAETANLKARVSMQLPVSEYLDRLVVTVIRLNTRSDTAVTITDGNNNPVTAGEDGVDYFHGTENPVDVYSIKSSRLDAGGRGKPWTIKSTRDVTVLIDREGSFRLNFLSPQNEISGLSNIFSVLERQPPDVELHIRFNLLDSQGKPVLTPQPISGTLILPDGTDIVLKELSGIKPDSDGVYDFGYNLSSIYPQILNSPGRYSFGFNAGVMDDQISGSPPVATGKLIVEAGRLPGIRSIAPQPVICEASQPFVLRVNIGDHETAREDSIQLKLVYDESFLEMQQEEPGLFTVNTESICTSLLSVQACSSQQSFTWKVQLDAALQDGSTLEPQTQDVQVRVIGPACTPTPAPTFTPTPLPEPTPVPDSDQDGVLDAEDSCPEQAGWKSAGGCIPWGRMASGFGILGAVVLSSSLFFSWVKVRTFGAPPVGYLLAEKDGKTVYGPFDLHKTGVRKRASALKVGSGRPGVHIYIPELAAVEFIIERKSIVTYVRNPEDKEGFVFLGDGVEVIHTSDPRMIIKVSLNPGILEGSAE